VARHATDRPIPLALLVAQPFEVLRRGGQAYAEPVPAGTPEETSAVTRELHLLGLALRSVIGQGEPPIALERLHDAVFEAGGPATGVVHAAITLTAARRAEDHFGIVSARIRVRDAQAALLVRVSVELRWPTAAARSRDGAVADLSRVA
jgi:hypothetical protein